MYNVFAERDDSWDLDRPDWMCCQKSTGHMSNPIWMMSLPHSCERRVHKLPYAALFQTQASSDTPKPTMCKIEKVEQACGHFEDRKHPCGEAMDWNLACNITFPQNMVLCEDRTTVNVSTEGWCWDCVTGFRDLVVASACPYCKGTIRDIWQEQLHRAERRSERNDRRS